MRMNPGDKLGPYEIIAPLGAGGMGEVYRARDTRLGRDVAIKVLPEHLTQNAEVLSRFEREARSISSLNHPHICTLHDVGREGDTEYLVMELVEGETLAARISRGALPLPELLKIGIQISDALDRAHRAGIVHRDFKPGNVMLAKSGAKLMDFGLARATGMGGMASGSGVTMGQLTQSPTMASPLTAEGTIVGTFMYMAPEQLEGREPDVRSDLWALGCVLYEMATGRRPFDGKSQASLIGAVMHTTPTPLATAAPMLPPALDSLIGACLTKDAEERIQTAHDVKLQLTWIAQSSSQSSMTATGAPALTHRRGAKREAIAWAVAAVALLAAGFFAWRGMSSSAASSHQQLRFTIPIPENITPRNMPRISPDGRIIAFAAQDSLNRTMIWVRPLNSLNANPLPGTEGTLTPFWSPDSRYLGFMAGGKLKIIPVAGGPADVVCDAPSGSDGTWSRDGVILYDGGNIDPIYRVNASGGVPVVAVPGDSLNQVGWPAFLPDGKHFFYTLITAGGTNKLMVGTLGKTVGQPLPITGSRVEYSPDGYLLFARERTLLAQPFDATALKTKGDPFPVAEDLPVGGNGVANFSVSANGVLVLRATGSSLSRLAWLDRAGHEIAEVAPAGDYRAPALSPDGNRVAVRRIDPSDGNIDVWIIDLMRNTTSRFTFDAASDFGPVWSPDGARIVWESNRGGTEGLWVKSANGVGADELLTKLTNTGSALDWSRDGKLLLYMGALPGSKADVYQISMDGDHTPQPLLHSPFAELRAYFSPDGRWLAYESDESGRSEVYVVSFRGAAGKWQISARGGSDPAWSADGRELFFLAGDQKLTSVSIAPGEQFISGLPQPMFRVVVEQGRRRNVYCPAPDGKRFLFQLPLSESNTPMTVMVNWRAGAGRK